MVEIGKYNTLEVVKHLDFGVYLDGGDGEEILLPKRYVPQDIKDGDSVEVFIYHDNEGRIIATTDKPYATAGQFAFLECRTVSEVGAFMDMGIMKDLLIPYREQKVHMEAGRWYIIYVHVDFVSHRLVGSAKLDRYLDNVPPTYEQNEEVNLMVVDRTDIGYKVIINNTHWGLIYATEVFRPLNKGQALKGYIKEVREDEKIDVSLSPQGYQKVEGIAGEILERIRKEGGFVAVHDKSDPEIIYAMFRCSKKAFKQAIGALYKKELIRIERGEGIRLITTEE